MIREVLDSLVYNILHSLSIDYNNHLNNHQIITITYIIGWDIILPNWIIPIQIKLNYSVDLLYLRLIALKRESTLSDCISHYNYCWASIFLGCSHLQDRHLLGSLPGQTWFSGP